MLFGIDSNRIISVEKGSYCQVQAIKDWNDSGKKVYLKGFGMVRIFYVPTRNCELLKKVRNDVIFAFEMSLRLRNDVSLQIHGAKSLKILRSMIGCA